MENRELIRGIQGKLFDMDIENKVKKNKFTSIELFAGAGGLALGLEKSGFEAIGLIEINKYAAKTLKKNRPKWNVINEDIEKNYCVYASRRDNRNYIHSHDEIKQKYGNAIVMDERMPDIFSGAMGNYMYTAKFKTKEEMEEFIDFVHKKIEE